MVEISAIVAQKGAVVAGLLRGTVADEQAVADDFAHASQVVAGLSVGGWMTEREGAFVAAFHFVRNGGVVECDVVVVPCFLQSGLIGIVLLQP